MEWSAGGSCITAADRKRLDKLIEMASSVLRCPLDKVEALGREEDVSISLKIGQIEIANRK